MKGFAVHDVSCAKAFESKLKKLHDEKARQKTLQNILPAIDMARAVVDINEVVEIGNGYVRITPEAFHSLRPNDPGTVINGVCRVYSTEVGGVQITAKEIELNV